MQSFRIRVRFLLFVVVLLGLYAHAQDLCTLTLLKDTQLRVVRGVSVLPAIEGMRLHQGDFLATGPSATAQVQLEFPGGAVVELGPSTQALLFSLTANAVEIVTATGWLKGESTSGTYRYGSPPLTATTKGGNVLLRAGDDAADIFVERGVAAVSAGTSAPITSSSDKIFFTRRAGKPVIASGRPSPEFISAMPVSFRDALPPRISRFAGKKPPEPKSEREVSYSDIERLLKLPPQWRRGLVDRFAARLQDHNFRQAIEGHIGALPEWKPVLNAQNQ